MFDVQHIREHMEQLLAEMEKQISCTAGQILVIGCSTSEIIGQRIGHGGTLEIAEAVYHPLKEFANKHSIFLAFQGCEHINRAITIEKQAADLYHLDVVTVIPMREAGGSLSAYAYRQLQEPVVVESLAGKAHLGIDIGQTLIGMHLKQVVVPVRTSMKHIGEAVVTLAKTRPKLIGGERAQYEL